VLNIILKMIFREQL